MSSRFVCCFVVLSALACGAPSQQAHETAEPEAPVSSDDSPHRGCRILVRQRTQDESVPPVLATGPTLTATTSQAIAELCRVPRRNGETCPSESLQVQAMSGTGRDPSSGVHYGLFRFAERIVTSPEAGDLPCQATYLTWAHDGRPREYMIAVDGMPWYDAAGVPRSTNGFGPDLREVTELAQQLAAQTESAGGSYTCTIEAETQNIYWRQVGPAPAVTGFTADQPCWADAPDTPSGYRRTSRTICSADLNCTSVCRIVYDSVATPGHTESTSTISKVSACADALDKLCEENCELDSLTVDGVPWLRN